MTALWPRVAQSLHALSKLWGPIPQIRRCDPNLKDDLSCRQNFHGDQYDKEILVLKTRVDVANMKAALQNEDLLVLIFKPNQDPRSFNILPSFVPFRAPGREIYGFLPNNNSRRDPRIHLAENPLLTRPRVGPKMADSRKEKISLHPCSYSR